jgi:hypothetical protein
LFNHCGYILYHHKSLNQKGFYSFSVFYIYFKVELVNSKKLRAIVSLYSIQEIYSFCKRTFSGDDVSHASKNALSILFKNEFALSGLLTREERLLHRAKFNMNDLSDQPHAISAFLNKCDAIVTYDTHFQEIKNVISIYAPHEVVAKFS